MHEASTQPRLLPSCLFPLLPVRIEGRNPSMDVKRFVHVLICWNFSQKNRCLEIAPVQKDVNRVAGYPPKFLLSQAFVCLLPENQLTCLSKLFPIPSDQLPGFHAQNWSGFYSPDKTMKAPRSKVTEKKNSNCRLDHRPEYEGGIPCQWKEISRSSFPGLFGVRRERVFQTGSRPERFLLMEHPGLFMEPLRMSWWIIYNIHWKHENNDVLLLVRALHCDFYTKISLMLPVVAAQNILDNIMVRITQENHASNAT